MRGCYSADGSEPCGLTGNATGSVIYLGVIGDVDLKRFDDVLSAALDPDPRALEIYLYDVEEVEV